MSNPARPPLEPTNVQLSMALAPDACLAKGFQDVAKRNKSLAVIQGVLSGRDMLMMPSFNHQREYCVEPRVLNANKQLMVTAGTGVPVPRIRSLVAKSMVNAAYAKLPNYGFASKDIAAKAIRERVYVSAGVEGSVMRIAHAYPTVGVRPPRPISRGEADSALERCGLDLSGCYEHELRPYPLLSEDGAQGVTINKHSSNGLPVLGKWDTPGAAQMVYSLALTVLESIRVFPGTVWEWLRHEEVNRPWLVTLIGQTKDDCYHPDKVSAGMMRFYNVMPRQIMLIMQRASQVLERLSKPMSGVGSHSFGGLTLVHGGAADMVASLEAQLLEDDWAYVHCGDDSWVITRREGSLCMFALDCSNFDLTQHASVTLEVHNAIHRQLSRIDSVSADLWYAYARERVVVVANGVTRRFLHAGPSGMPLQSKVNDVLMDVMINRLKSALYGAPCEEEEVGVAVEKTARQLGFVAKLEQFWSGPATTLVEALERRPFLFVGSYFHIRNGEVRVCADLPRTLGQMPYPSVKWAVKKEELKVKEAMRLGSIVLGLGMPPLELEETFAVMKTMAVSLISEVLATQGDIVDNSLRWAVAESPWGPDVQPSLTGLRNAILRDPAELWLRKETELPSTSQFVVPSNGVNWADIVEEEEEEESRAGPSTGMRSAAAFSHLRRLVLKRGVKVTHPVTPANDGRPAPTAVWGPDKAPKVVRPEIATGGRRARRRDGDDYRYFHAMLRDAEDEVEIDDGYDENGY